MPQKTTQGIGKTRVQASCTKGSTMKPLPAPRVALPQARNFEWADETPEDLTQYQLAMWIDDQSAQEVEVSRAEFIALKLHLAAMRGRGVRSASDATAELAEKELAGEAPRYSLTDTHQAAMHLQTARDMYRLAPYLVVYESEEFDAALNEMAE